MRNQISVLYVDDEPDLLDLCKIFLERTAGFSVTTACGVDEAFALLAAREFDTIISDYQMPGMDGIEFLKRVKMINRSIPFILFTGRGREEVVIEALNHGADFYLQKGGDPKAQFAELANKVRHAVSRRKALQQIEELRERESQIINFLPDATFAIDTDHVVIAWNHAMEQLCGISAADMIGKGDYEYSLPFYFERRPMLIDYVLEKNPEMKEKYPKVRAFGPGFSAEVERPWTRDGKTIYFWITACPLYDLQGKVIGAIESLRDITPLYHAREKLEESELRYRLTLEASNEGIWDWNIKTGASYFSPSWFTMLGYEPDEFPANIHTWEMLLHPDDREITRQQIQDYIFHRVETYSVEFRMRTKQGGWRWILGRGKVIEWDYDGSPLRMVGTHTDITDLKLIEEKLRLDESRLETLFTLTQMTSQSIDDITNYALKKAVRLTKSQIGYVAFLNQDETILTIHAWSDEAMDECQVKDRKFIYRLEETGLWGEPVRQRRPIVTNDYAAPHPHKKGIPEGHVKLYCHLGVPIFDQGQIVMLVGVANKLDQYGDDDIRQLTLLMNGVWNIIQRKRSDEALLRSNEELSAAYEQITAAEEELRAQYEIISATMKEKQKQEEQHRFILENIPDPVVILTFEGMVLYANPAAYAIVEMNPDAALFPLNISELLATESVHKAMNDLAEIEQKHRVVAEYILLTKSGGLRVVEAAGVVIQWKGQDAVLVSLRDITGREEDKDALMQANRKLAILSSITRHDILNQVAALLGYLEMMHDQDLIEETQRYIEKCLACTKTIQSQIAFTKLVDDIRNKSLSWQYTEHMVTRVLRNIAMGAITCHMHVCGLYLYADPIFEKVIYALVENSLRHGEHVSSMVFSYQIDGEECIFVFEDNGIGIPDDEKEKIFRQGYGKNTGLGLFLIREILAINEMSIKETGTYGTGARFEITVPGGKWMVNEAKP